MLDWQDLRFLLAVARHGTLSGAARDLGVDHATVSRRLAALEATLDARAVERLPRSVRLTALGQQLLVHAQQMQAAADGVERLARAAHAPLAGRVALSAAPVLVASLLAGQLGRFHQHHPHIQLSIAAQGQMVSLSRREADVVLRLVKPTDAGDVARRIGRMPFGLYAHRRYLAQHAPTLWQFIAYEPHYDRMPQQQWLLGAAAGRPVVCALNYIGEHLIAARAGVGVAGLPCFLAEREPDLVRIEEDVAPFQRDVWIATHRDLRRTPAVRAVLDFVSGVIAGEPGLALPERG